MLVSKDILKNSTKTGEFSPFSFNKFKLLDRKKVNHDTILLRFEANGMKMSSNNTVNHICERIVGLGIWSIDIKDHYIQTFRSYTPIDSNFVGSTTHNASNLDTKINGSAGFLSKYLIAGKQFVDGLRANNSSESTQKGYFDVIVKRYPDGSVSKFIHNLKPGEYVEIRGPNLTFPYYPNTKKHIGMIAGGTGIAPMYQLLKKLLLEKPRDEIPKITLIYANKSLQDILLHDQLNKLREEFPEHLDIHYVVENISSPAENTLLNSDYRSFDPHEQFGLGIIGKDLLGKSLPPVDSSTVVLVSGPDGMMDHICGMKPIDGQQGPLSGILKGLGYSSEMVYKM
ncbi:NADH-cytochrome b5 reductase-like protein [Zancudomyces culisetae]|nr:NADH-cytochrome b5 reductase-like protein [Zancudomyces culisetae]|eukprot:OMH81206.1 NADH-cytochrome b5 reductase-like protein [Zancudomyces culisetae]